MKCKLCITDDFKYFKLSEFDSPDDPGSGKKMCRLIISKLDIIRRFYGKPIIINSGYRTPMRNLIVGGATDSSHLTGYAVDIPTNDDNDRFVLVELALKCGITRVGIYKRHIHLDVDPSKPQEVIWMEDYKTKIH